MWKFKTSHNLRKIASLKNRLDYMEKVFNKDFSIDHGIANYAYSHYEYNSPSVENNFTESIDLYVHEYTKNDPVIFYMTLTDELLRKPTKADEHKEFVDAYYDSNYPSILVVSDYTTPWNRG